jgi:hypothetical protein
VGKGLKLKVSQSLRIVLLKALILIWRNDMILKLTQAQFDSDVALLKVKNINVTGPKGTLEADGCTVDYNYVGGVLTINVVKKPFFLSEDHVERVITSWFNKPIPPPMVIPPAGAPAYHGLVQNIKNKIVVATA